MDLHNIQIEEIPHGHGTSFKKGVSDGILNQDSFKNDLPNGHNASYIKGISLGEKLQKVIAKKVKKQ